jgi:hypothetical protein
MPLTPFQPRPGFVTTESEYVAEGRAVAGDKVRNHRGRFEKLAGSVKLDGTNTFAGKARGLIGWMDNSGHIHVGIGTHVKLYDWSPSTYVDVTPLDTAGTLASNPIRTVTGSGTATITHSAHGRSPGDYVTYGGAAAVGGITINGEYQVLSAPSANALTLVHTSTATASATGGGTAVTFDYQIPIGLENTVPGFGFGAGVYGTSSFGVPQRSSVPLPARTWSLDHFGEDLLALHRSGELYVRDTSVGGRAALVTQAPTDNRAMFMSDDKKVVLLGAGGDPMKMQWCHTGDYTLWTPASNNDAGSKQLVGGSELRSGAPGKGYQVAWSDTDFFLARNLFSDPIYDVQRVGEGAGIIGPLAWAEQEGTHYWMGPQGLFQYDGVSLSPIPNQDDVRQAIYGDMNLGQSAKFHAGSIAKFREIIFFWVSAEATEIDRYAIYDRDDKVWVTGTAVRTAFEQSDAYDVPLATTTTGYLLQHETGVDDHDGSALYAWIKFAGVDLGDGDVAMDLFGIVPDMQRQIGDLTWTFYGRDYPTEDERIEDQVLVRPDTDLEDLRVSGKLISVKVESNEVGGDFRFGKPRLDIQRAGARR